MFEVPNSDKLSFYLDWWDLVIHIIDDAAPVSTDEREPIDEIGFVKIPLRALMVDDWWIDSWFPIINKLGENCGLLDIEIVLTENIHSNLVA